MIFVVLTFQRLGLNIWLNIVGKVILGASTYGLYLFLFSRTEIKWFVHQLLCLKNKK
jgi:hypothetical protein